MSEPQLACAVSTPAEYCALRLAAGLSPMDESAATRGNAGELVRGLVCASGMSW